MIILIIEDEKEIANQWRLFLEGQGHIVRTASDGESGLYHYRRSLGDEAPFDLVITDYRMPLKNGAKVIEEILTLKPDQIIILATAYNMDLAREEGIPRNKVSILTKPFTFDELENLIRKKTGKTPLNSIS